MDKIKRRIFHRQKDKKIKKNIGRRYLKLLLLSLKDEGKLYYDGVESDFIKELALIIDETDDMETDISIPIKNIINEIYAVDTSRKIKAVYKEKGLDGKHTGSHAIYGYKKDPEDKDKWIIDEEAAKVVKKIYSLVVSGLGLIR